MSSRIGYGNTVGGGVVSRSWERTKNDHRRLEQPFNHEQCADAKCTIKCMRGEERHATEGLLD